MKNQIESNVTELATCSNTLKNSCQEIQSEINKVKEVNLSTNPSDDQNHSKFKNDVKKLCKELIESIQIKEKELIKASDDIETPKGTFLPITSIMLSEKIE